MSTLTTPPAHSQEIINIKDNDIINLELELVGLEKVEQNLVIHCPNNSSIVLQNYFVQHSLAELNYYNQTLSPDFWQEKLAEFQKLEQAERGGRFHEYTNDAILSGVEALKAGHLSNLDNPASPKNNLEKNTTAIDTQPEVQDLNLSLQEDGLIQISANVLKNAIAGDGTNTLFWLDKVAQYGSIQVNSDGTFIYVLNNDSQKVQALAQGESLIDSIRFTYQDQDGDQAEGQVIITIIGTNDKPQATASVNQSYEDSLISSGQLVASDPDSSDKLTFIAQNIQGQYGTFTLQPNGAYQYTVFNNLEAIQSLALGSKLSEHFDYSLVDNHGASASSQLTINIYGTNDKPTVGASTAVISEDTTQINGTLVMPSDIDQGDQLAFISQNSQGQYGTFTLASDGTYIYTLNNSLNTIQTLGLGEKLYETFTYTVSDDKGGTNNNIITISINGTNDLPQVNAALNSLNEDLNTIASGNLPTPTDLDSHDTLTFIPQISLGQYGLLTLQPDGSYRYQVNNSSIQSLAQGSSTSEQFTYTVSDGHGLSNNILTLTIYGTNDAPTVGASTNHIYEDSLELNGNISTAHDQDFGDQLTFTTQTIQGQYGTLSLLADGSYNYKLNNALMQIQGLGKNESLSEDFNYSVHDKQGASASNILTITIIGTNDSPILSATSLQISEDTSQIIGHLAQIFDSDNQDSILSDNLNFVSKVSENGLYGTFTLLADGTYTYNLNNSLKQVQGLGLGEKLSDSFIYTAYDNHGAYTSNVLTVIINGTNDKPSLSPQYNNTYEDSGLVSGTLNASDLDNILKNNDILSYTLNSNTHGSYGTLILNSDGTYNYSLNNSLNSVQGLTQGEKLYDTFTFTVSDNHGGQTSQTLTLVVNGTNDNPVAYPISGTVREDRQTVLTGTIPNPSDPDNNLDNIASDKLSVLAFSNLRGAYGQLSMDSAGHYTYKLYNSRADIQALNSGESRQEIFNYLVYDQHGGSSIQSLTITVLGTSDRKDDDDFSNLKNNLTEDTNTFCSGILPISKYSNNTNFTFETESNDLIGKYGTFTLNSNGSYTYTLNNALIQSLNSGDVVKDVLNYTIVDSKGHERTNKLTITINGTDETPIPQVHNDVVSEDSKLYTTGSLVPAESNSLILFKPIQSQSQYGTLVLQENGQYTYILNNNSQAVQALAQNEKMQDIFTYQIRGSNGEILSSQLIINASGSNDEPQISAHSQNISEDTNSIVGNLPQATDLDLHDTLNLQASSQDGLYGHFTLNPNGSYTYTLNNSLGTIQGLGVNESLQESFNYTVYDSHGLSATNIITFTINGQNDLAIAPEFTDNKITEDAQSYTTGQLPSLDPDNFADQINSDLVSFIPQTNVAGQYGTFYLSAAGVYSYTLNNSLDSVQGLGQGESLTDTFNYSITDQHGQIVNSSINIIINGTNDALSLDASFATIDEDTQYISATLTAHDPDNQLDNILSDKIIFTLQSDELGKYGTLTLNPDGTYNYTLSSHAQTLNQNEQVQDSFNYLVSDGHGSQAESTLTITINGQNDAPHTLEANSQSLSGTLQSSEPDLNNSPSHIQENYASLLVESNADFIYTPNSPTPSPNEVPDIFNFAVNDSHGSITSSELIINLNSTPNYSLSPEPINPIPDNPTNDTQLELAKELIQNSNG